MSKYKKNINFDKTKQNKKPCWIIESLIHKPVILKILYLHPPSIFQIYNMSKYKKNVNLEKKQNKKKHVGKLKV